MLFRPFERESIAWSLMTTHISAEREPFSMLSMIAWRFDPRPETRTPILSFFMSTLFTTEEPGE